MFALLLATALADPVSDLDAGKAALTAKDYATAREVLGRCVAADPKAEECFWQLGWAAWGQRDWAGVVDAWTKLLALNPSYPKAAEQLATARGQLEIQRLAAAARAAAPEKFVSAAPEGASIRLRAVGDMMIGTAFPEGYLPPDGGASAFIGVLPQLQDADFTFGNLEGPLCDTDEPSTKCRPDAAPGSCYAFRTPTSYAHWYKDAGFDVVSTANNHAGDFGETCRTQTEATLDGLGIRYSGRPGTIARWTQNGLKLALIGFHSQPSAHDLTDIPTAVALVKGLAAENDIVIVSMHAGAEGSKAQHVPNGPELFYGENRGDLRAFTHAVVDAGADLVLGHGPHVLRGMEAYAGRLIVYSMGNFSTYGRFNLSGPQAVGAIVDVTLGRDGRFVAGKLLGTEQIGDGIPKLDPANQGADLVRLLSEQDFPGTGVAVAQDGTLAFP